MGALGQILRQDLVANLNDRFDNTLRRITVSNGSTGGTEFVFNEAETPPNPETDPNFFNESETDQPVVTGFTVFVPTQLTPEENQIRAWLDNVLINGTDYNITYT